MVLEPGIQILNREQYRGQRIANSSQPSPYTGIIYEKLIFVLFSTAALGRRFSDTDAARL
jgi:hypothetical protein